MYMYEYSEVASMKLLASWTVSSSVSWEFESGNG